MKFILAFLVIWSSQVFAWGSVGHKIVAEIASRNLSSKASEEVKKILGNETLPQIASWADVIRKQKSRPYAAWHIVNIPEGKTYAEWKKKSADEDIVEGLEILEKKLRDKNLSLSDKNEALKLFVHFMGDLHQPLHSGYPDDKGGTRLKVVWREEAMSLHELWDTGIIDDMKLGYLSYVGILKEASKEQSASWQKASYVDISDESRAYLKELYKYDMKEDHWENKYSNKNIDFLNQRLLQAGIRLAFKLNDIFK